MAPVILISSGAVGAAHDTGVGHVERAARLQAVEAGIRAAGVEDALIRLPGRAASREELVRVHRPDYLDRVERFIAAGGGDLDPDTTVSVGSWDAALLAAGSGVVAIEALDRGQAAAAFVSARPPGHHATPTVAMGFCIVNNVAVAAALLAARGERVVIVDWDVHHGNGTQEIFWDDPRVLYVSLHEWPQYPGTGRPNETGGTHAPDTTVNIPLPAGATGDCARAALDEIVAPAVEVFAPTWVLVSAGFDAHRDDPLGGLAWTAGDYADLTATVAAWAPAPGRLLAFLEGGYDLQGLARSAGATVAAMAGHDYRPEPPSAGGPGRDLVAALAARRATSPGHSASSA